MSRFPQIICISLFTAALTVGCAGPNERQDGQANTDAYVYNANEFNRNSPSFAQIPVKIDSVTVCYNKYGTNPAIVAKMAAEECQKFSKKAEFVRQSLSVCPLFTPVAAIYKCIDGNK